MRVLCAAISERFVANREAGCVQLILTGCLCCCVYMPARLSTSMCIPSLCMHRSRTLPGAAGHIYHSRRERRFSGPSTVTPVFKGRTRVCLVFSAVSPWPSAPLLAIGGGGMGGGGVRARLLDAGWAPIWSQLEPVACEKWPQLDTHSSFLCLLGPVELTAAQGMKWFNYWLTILQN